MNTKRDDLQKEIDYLKGRLNSAHAAMRKPRSNEMFNDAFFFARELEAELKLKRIALGRIEP